MNQQQIMAKTICDLHWGQRHKARCLPLVSAYNNSMMKIKSWTEELGVGAQTECSKDCTYVDVSHRLEFLTDIETFANSSMEELARVTTKDDHSIILDYLFLAINSIRIWQTQLASVIMLAKQGYIHPMLFSQQQHLQLLSEIQTKLDGTYIQQQHEITIQYNKTIIQLNIDHQLNQTLISWWILVIIGLVIIQVTGSTVYCRLRRKGPNTTTTVTLE